MQKMNQGSHRLADSPLPPDGSSQKPKFWFSIHASPGGTSKSPGNFWEFFQKRKNKESLIIQRHHIHPLPYKNITDYIYT